MAAKKPLKGKLEEKQSSLMFIQLAGFLLVNFVLWGIAAGLFNAGSGVESSRRTGSNIILFVVSAVATLPQMGAVIADVWANHKWFVAVFAVAETLLILFFVWMRQVDADLKQGNPFRKR